MLSAKASLVCSNESVLVLNLIEFVMRLEQIRSTISSGFRTRRAAESSGKI